MKQQVCVESQELINKWLAQGWRVVPGAFSAASAGTGSHYGGTAHHKVYAILEKDVPHLEKDVPQPETEG